MSAVIDDPTTYEHISPELVVITRLLFPSSPEEAIAQGARSRNIDLSKDDTAANDIVKIIKDLEDCGFQFEGADASVRAPYGKSLGEHMRSFRLKGFREVRNEGAMTPTRRPRPPS